MDIEYLKSKTSEERKDAQMIGNIWREFERLWEMVIEFSDLSNSLYKRIIIQETMINQIITQIPNTPDTDKQIAAMKGKLEELEQFQNHILKTVADRPVPKETKPPEGMYE